MSAYVCGDPAIDVLVRAGLRYKLVTRASADLVGQALRAENVASVTYRYADIVGGGAMPGPVALPDPITQLASGGACITPASYRYTPRVEGEPRLDPAKVLTVISCYSYQSCEHRGWDGSAAHAYIEALDARIRRAHPGIDRDGGAEAWDPSEIAACHAR